MLIVNKTICELCSGTGGAYHDVTGKFMPCEECRGLGKIKLKDKDESTQ